MVSVNKNDIASESFETFKGRFFPSFRGFLVCYTLLFIIFTIVIGFLLMTLMITALLTFHIWFLHYFQVSDNYLLVRNLGFFWKRKMYPLSELKEICFDTHGKLPNYLQIPAEDKIFPAGTLRYKDWLALQAKLESKGIIVKNYLEEDGITITVDHE